MKRNWRNSWHLEAILISVMLIVSNACVKREQAHEHAYTCPMHPTVISDRPGTCPVCGMDLVRKARPGEEIEITKDLAKLLKSPNEVVVSSVKTIKGQYRPLPVSLNAQGVVVYDARNIFSISSRVGGRMEKVYLKYAFQPVSKGEKVAEIYSPELLTAQRELLFLINNDPENKALIHAARNKLELLGLTNLQIDNLIEEKEIKNSYPVFSPYSGYLVTDGSASPTSGVAIGTSSKSDMNTMAPDKSATVTSEEKTSNGILREGRYVIAGETLFRLVNTDAIRIELNLSAEQGSQIKKGNRLSLDFGGGNTEQALVDFVQPFFNEGQQFVKLRVHVKNKEYLHIGHLVTARIYLPGDESLWIPRQAVVDLGMRNAVFVKEGGVFKPRNVVTGIFAEGFIEIKSGLASSEEIAASAQYLVDSESFIKTTK